MMEMIIMIAVVVIFMVVAVRFTLMGKAEEQRRRERIEFEKRLAEKRAELEAEKSATK